MVLITQSFKTLPYFIKNFMTVESSWFVTESTCKSVIVSIGSIESIDVEVISAMFEKLYFKSKGIYYQNYRTFHYKHYR